MSVTLTLVDPTDDLDALAATLADDHGGDVGEARATLDILTERPRAAPWGTDGVEIDYGTFAPARGTGVAKATAAGLVAIAAADPANTPVFAHTAREGNASTRVLKACGFVFDGEVEVPDDGPVWRWVLPAS